MVASHYGHCVQSVATDMILGDLEVRHNTEYDSLCLKRQLAKCRWTWCGL